MTNENELKEPQKTILREFILKGQILRLNEQQAKIALLRCLHGGSIDESIELARTYRGEKK